MTDGAVDITVGFGSVTRNFTSLAVAFSVPIESVQALAADAVNGRVADVFLGSSKRYFGLTLIGAEVPAFPAGLAARVLFPDGTGAGDVAFDHAKTYLEVDAGRTMLPLIS